MFGCHDLNFALRILLECSADLVHLQHSLRNPFRHIEHAVFREGFEHALVRHGDLLNRLPAEGLVQVLRDHAEYARYREPNRRPR